MGLFAKLASMLPNPIPSHRDKCAYCDHWVHTEDNICPECGNPIDYGVDDYSEYHEKYLVSIVKPRVSQVILGSLFLLLVGGAGYPLLILGFTGGNGAWIVILFGGVFAGVGTGIFLHALLNFIKTKKYIKEAREFKSKVIGLSVDRKYIETTDEEGHSRTEAVYVYTTKVIVYSDSPFITSFTVEKEPSYAVGAEIIVKVWNNQKIYIPDACK